jgi:hypothetical protein
VVSQPSRPLPGRTQNEKRTYIQHKPTPITPSGLVYQHTTRSHVKRTHPHPPPHASRHRGSCLRAALACASSEPHPIPVGRTRAAFSPAAQFPGRRPASQSRQPAANGRSPASQPRQPAPNGRMQPSSPRSPKSPPPGPSPLPLSRRRRRRRCAPRTFVPPSPQRRPDSLPATPADVEPCITLRAGVVIVGDEILSGKVTDTNTPFLCRWARPLSGGRGARGAQSAERALAPLRRLSRDPGAYPTAAAASVPCGTTPNPSDTPSPQPPQTPPRQNPPGSCAPSAGASPRWSWCRTRSPPSPARWPLCPSARGPGVWPQPPARGSARQGLVCGVQQGCRSARPGPAFSHRFRHSRPGVPPQRSAQLKTSPRLPSPPGVSPPVSWTLC